MQPNRPSLAAWVNGHPNFGFVLRGEDANLLAFTNYSCLSLYCQAQFDPKSNITE